MHAPALCALPHGSYLSKVKCSSPRGMNPGMPFCKSFCTQVVNALWMMVLFAADSGIPFAEGTTRVPDGMNVSVLAA